MRLPKTLNVQVGRKFITKTKEEILKEVVSVFKTFGVVAVQLLYDCIRVTLKTVGGLGQLCAMTAFTSLVSGAASLGAVRL